MNQPQNSSIYTLDSDEVYILLSLLIDSENRIDWENTDYSDWSIVRDAIAQLAYKLMS